MSHLVRIFLFLSVALGALYFTNLVVYEGVALAFGITSTTHLVLLGLGLGVLSLSFILASFLGSRYYNFFTRAFYILSAVWLGSLLYTLIASVAYIVYAAVWGQSSAVGTALYAAAVLISIYGVIHARHIHIVRRTITLPNLPQAWRGKTALWVSDIHLGQVHGPWFAERIVKQSTQLSPDIIFVGGDVYDGTGAPDVAELTAPLKALTAPLGTYFIAGNHEEYGNHARFLGAVRSVGMRVLDDEMVEIDGLQLIGVDYRNTQDAARFTQTLSRIAIDKSKPSILLKHEPKDIAVAETAGISLQISGHTHKAQQWPLEYIAQLAYKGFAYGLNRYQQMQVYTSSGVGTWGPPMRVGTNGEIVLFTFQ